MRGYYSMARALNYGTRIDYIFVNKRLTKSSLEESIIMPDVQGSDHCPVKTTLNVDLKAAKKCPPLCTKYLPEFTGKQQKLLAFFKKNNSSQKSDDSSEMESNSQSSSKSDTTSSEDSKSGLKWCASDSTQPKPKKPKLEKHSSGSKQSSLMSFFTKPKSSNNSKSEKTENTQTKHEPVKVTVVHKSDSVPKAQTAGAWKNLLRGPPPAPLCKGHKEPCVLRTVKKDSLNKGRQFYVCTKPEGPKSNPESRCDHFEWVEKKKK